MSDNRDVAKTLLTEAGRTILKDRPGIHGSAENSFQMIADFWTVHTRHLRKVRGHDNLFPEDVAEMMTMLKKARKVYGVSSNADNDVDDIGYAALAGMLRLPDPAKSQEQEKTDDMQRAIADVFVQKDNPKIDTRGVAERTGISPSGQLESTEPMLGDYEVFAYTLAGDPLTKGEVEDMGPGVKLYDSAENAAAARAEGKPVA